MKTCYACKAAKCVSEFFKDKSRTDGLQRRCKACDKERQQSEPYKEKAAKRSKEYSKSAKSSKEHSRSEKYKEYKKEYNKVYQKRRYATDAFYRIKRKLCNLTRDVLRRGKFNYLRKTSRSIKLLGADFHTIQRHLISSATRNYGKYFPARKYHIDHIQPLSSATSEAELISLQHYTNLQFLYPKDNLTKSDNAHFTPIKR